MLLNVTVRFWKVRQVSLFKLVEKVCVPTRQQWNWKGRRKTMSSKMYNDNHNNQNENIISFINAVVMEKSDNLFATKKEILFLLIFHLRFTQRFTHTHTHISLFFPLTYVHTKLNWIEVKFLSFWWKLLLFIFFVSMSTFVESCVY